MVFCILSETSRSSFRIASASLCAALSAAGPGARAVRIYYDALNVFPAQWPDRLPGA